MIDERGKKWDERRRRDPYEARISRHEIAKATGENLRLPCNGSRELAKFSGPSGRRETEKERRQVRDVRWAAPRDRASQAPPLLFTETDRRSNGAARNRVPPRPRTIFLSPRAASSYHTSDASPIRIAPLRLASFSSPDYRFTTRVPCFS